MDNKHSEIQLELSLNLGKKNHFLSYKNVNETIALISRNQEIVSDKIVIKSERTLTKLKLT